MYKVESYNNSTLFSFSEIDLKIKAVNDGLYQKVYINIKGYNPLFSMLIGGFEEECSIDSLDFSVKKENERNFNTAYAIVENKSIELFVMNVYHFLIENKVERMLEESDKIT